MQYIPLFLYNFRWPVEVSYYEQKTFWSLCSYMLRSQKGIEMLVNLINLAYFLSRVIVMDNTSSITEQKISILDAEQMFALAGRGNNGEGVWLYGKR